MFNDGGVFFHIHIIFPKNLFGKKKGITFVKSLKDCALSAVPDNDSIETKKYVLS